MKTRIKIALIAGSATVIAAIIGLLDGKVYDINNSQTINVNVDNKLANTDVKDCEQLLDSNNELLNSLNNLQSQYEELKKQFDSLQSKNKDLENIYSNISIENDNLIKQNEELSKQIEQLMNTNEENSVDEVETEIIDNGIYLNNLPIFNCQYYDRGSWVASEIPEWKIYEDRAADGNVYENAVHMSVHGNWAGFAQIILVDYLLDEKYETFNGNFMLDEASKSTASIVTLKIYGDEKMLYECNNITGGFIPKNTGDIFVRNVNRLRFEYKSDSGELGSTSFGVVFL